MSDAGAYRPHQIYLETLSGRHGRYETLRPAPDLARHIHYYWILETFPDAPGAMFPLRLIPNACTDVVIEWSDPRRNWVSHSAQSNAVRPISKGLTLLGIEFFPLGLHHFLSLPLDEIRHEITPLAPLCPRTARSLQLLCETSSTPRGCVPRLDDFFRERFRHVRTRGYEAVAAALAAIYRRQSLRDVDSVLSSRHLRRLFHAHTGFSPKRLCSIVRFQHCLGHMSAHPEDRTFYFDYGFSDQAHFIKDFRKHAGVPPSAARDVRFLQSQRGDRG